MGGLAGITVPFRVKVQGNPPGVHALAFASGRAAVIVGSAILVQVKRADPVQAIRGQDFRQGRLNVLGEIDELPLPTRQVLRHAMAKTADCTGMTLNLALNYSGRHEILRACQALIQNGVKAADLTEDLLAAHLYTAGMPDPDLILRTSGEQRLSNYLLFQSAYSELYFTDVAWPDFHAPELHAALEEFGRRQRRFGATGENNA